MKMVTNIQINLINLLQNSNKKLWLTGKVHIKCRMSSLDLWITFYLSGFLTAAEGDPSHNNGRWLQVLPRTLVADPAGKRTAQPRFNLRQFQYSLHGFCCLFRLSTISEQTLNIVCVYFFLFFCQRSYNNFQSATVIFVWKEFLPLYLWI
jgi:hypothetical protein